MGHEDHSERAGGGLARGFSGAKSYEAFAMQRADPGAFILPSILDRLLDDAPDVSHDALPDRFQTLRQLKQAVTRDLEALLNTRQAVWEELAVEYTELHRSLLVYGLPDFSAFSPLEPHDRNRIRRAVEQAIALFEPRLSRVRVTLETPRQHEHTLLFHIEALLRLEPAPEPVVFDAMLQLHTQEYTVRGQT
jgi:type VI secretion system protein ImpF